MGALRTRLGQIVRGGEQAAIANAVIRTDARLAAMEQAVAALERRLDDLEAGQAGLRERQLDEFDRVRDAVATATDDLSARVAALSERIDERSGRP